MKYCPYLKKENIDLLGKQLLLFKATNMDSKMLSLIIVPALICRKLLNRYHRNPSGGHMGAYKTLHRLRMRLF